MSTNVQTVTASGVNPPAHEDSTPYVVRAGDTLSAIAEAHGVTLEALEDANPGILHPDLIRPGQRLEIPSARGEAQSRPSSYTVRAGDTLSGIGGRLGADWRLLAQLNHVEDPRHLQIGATLRVPAPTMHATGRPTTSTPAGGVAGHAGASAALVKPGTVSSRGIPDTSNLTQAQKVQLYSAYIDTYGDARAKADLAAGRQVILGLRHDTNTHANGGGGAYDDRIVVVSRSGVREFVGNTEPSARYEGRFGSPAPDGRLALGRIAEGSDRFTRDYSPHLGDVLRPTGSVKIDRDTSHDGAFDGPNTRSISTDELFLFHAGGSTITGSAGCQTLRPADFSRFWSDLNQGQKQFSYVLVEADRHGVKSAPTAQPSASRQPRGFGADRRWNERRDRPLAHRRCTGQSTGQMDRPSPAGGPSGAAALRRSSLGDSGSRRVGIGLGTQCAQQQLLRRQRLRIDPDDHRVCERTARDGAGLFPGV